MKLNIHSQQQGYMMLLKLQLIRPISGYLKTSDVDKTFLARQIPGNKALDSDYTYRRK